jgi:hypothetical protein
MAMTTTDSGGPMQKLARYGAGGVLAAGAAALIVYARSDQGRQKLAALFGAQFETIEGQLQDAIRENMPLIDEAIDRLVETLHQGVNSISGEIDRLGDMVRDRINDYAKAIPATASGGSDQSTGTHG